MPKKQSLLYACVESFDLLPVVKYPIYYCDPLVNGPPSVGGYGDPPVNGLLSVGCYGDPLVNGPPSVGCYGDPLILSLIHI